MRTVLLFLCALCAHAAIPVSTIWEVQQGSTAGNVNGVGFDYAGTGMATNMTATLATSDAPVVCSASYNFVATDQNRWLFIQSGTNWTPGWYKISTTATNCATLSASLGTAVQIDATKGPPTPRFTTNTTAGVATTASPTGGVWTMDYSQALTANNLDLSASTTDLASADGDASPCVITSASYTFGPNTVRNFVHVVSGTGWTAGWYVIASVAGGAATLDRACGTDGAKTGGVWNLGGAASLGSTLDDDLFENSTATNGSGANRWFVKYSATSYTLGETVLISAAGGTQAPVVMEGYKTLRGDAPSKGNQPYINGATNPWTNGSNFDWYYMRFRCTASNCLTGGTSGKLVYSSVKNDSATADRGALLPGTNYFVWGSDLISYRGRALNGTASATIMYSLLHDSKDCAYLSSGTHTLIGNIISGCTNAAVNVAAALTTRTLIDRNTFYGAENKLGTAISFTSGSTIPIVTNNICYGFATCYSHPDVQTSAFSDYNNNFNNTNVVTSNDYTKWAIGFNGRTDDPVFSLVGQVTNLGTVSTSSTTLTDTTQNFSTAGILADRDFVYITGGTGCATGIYGIVTVGTTTLTLDIAPGCSASNVTYQINRGHNYQTAAPVSVNGFPGSYPGGYTESISQIGAATPGTGGSGGQKTCIYVADSIYFRGRSLWSSNNIKPETGHCEVGNVR